jgi:hypothetical protein
MSSEILQPSPKGLSKLMRNALMAKGAIVVVAVLVAVAFFDSGSGVDSSV